MTSEQRDELLQSLDLFRQTVFSVSRACDDAGALAVVVASLDECEQIIAECAA